MPEERVDKQWREKGLGGYSTAAIIGTLNHYGVKLDEAAIREAGQAQTPMELAHGWRALWKGKGQFDAFPYAAANELLERLFPERPTPRKVASALVEATVVGVKVVDGGADDLGTLLGRAETLLQALPPEGDSRDTFVSELAGIIDPWARAFGDLPRLLAKAAKGPEALRVAAIHETLFPDRKGCATAVVQASLGEREPAVSNLKQWAEESGRDVFARYHALDALYQIDAWAEVKAAGLGVFDAAAAAGKWHLADSAAHLLGHLVDETDVDLAFAQEVERRLALAHEKTGGHHH